MKKNKQVDVNSEDAIGTALASHLPWLKEETLAQAQLPVPQMSVCLAKLQRLSDASQNQARQYGHRKTKEKILIDKSTLKQVLLNKQSKYTHLSIESKILLRQHYSRVGNLLLYAQYLHEFEAKKDDQMVKKYQRLYIQEKIALRDKIGEAVFQKWTKDLMQQSHYKGYEHFGMLFYADSYCEPAFQAIADVANMLYLGGLEKQHKMPDRIKFSDNLFGTETEYLAKPLEAGWGHILLPADLTQSSNVYVVISALAPSVDDLAAREQVAAQIQLEMAKLNPPLNWKVNIKMVGANADADKEQKKKKEATGAGVSADKEEKQKKDAPGAKGGFSGLGGLFLNNQALMPNSLGAAGVGVKMAQDSGLLALLDEAIKKADQQLKQDHSYRKMRPGLKFMAQNAVPFASAILTGASIGTTIPGMGTAVGALIGLGVAVAQVTVNGYCLCKKLKEEKIQKALLEQVPIAEGKPENPDKCNEKKAEGPAKEVLRFSQNEKPLSVLPSEEKKQQARKKYRPKTSPRPSAKGKGRH